MHDRAAQLLVANFVDEPRAWPDLASAREVSGAHWSQRSRPRRACEACAPLPFYLGMGYVITGVLPDANGPGTPDIFMSKSLAAR